MSLGLWEFFWDPAAWAATGVTADLSVTEANDTVAAAGTLAIACTASLTEQNDTIAATAVVALVASLTVTEGGDSLSGSGTVALSGTLVATEANDALTSAGSVAIVCTLAVTEADDDLVASGTTLGVSGVTGDLAAIEGNDTILADATRGQMFGGGYDRRDIQTAVDARKLRLEKKLTLKTRVATLNVVEDNDTVSAGAELGDDEEALIIMLLAA